MKRAVLFDIDGTLLDTWDFVIKARDYSLSFHGYTPSKEQLSKALGKPLIEFYKILAPGVDPLQLMQTHIEFQKQNPQLVQLFPKTKKILKYLKDHGFLLAAISNRMRQSLLKSLKETEIDNLFDVVLSVDDVKNPKPHKEHVLTALKLLKVELSNAYLVGDTGEDILAGKNAKIKTVGVTYGFLGKDIVKHNPDYVIDDISELLKILKCDE